MVKRFRKSIAVQMTLLVLGSTALVLALVETYSYVRTRDMILDTGEAVAMHLTRSMTRRLEQDFRVVEKVPETLSLFLAGSQDNTGLIPLLHDYIRRTPEVFGGGVFFEPGGRPAGGSGFHVFRENGRISENRPDRAGYGYDEKPFYILPKVFNHPVWTDPYFDYGGGNILKVTYSAPLYRPGPGDSRTRTFRGVVTADISLKRLSELTRSVHMGKRGFSFIITDTGVFVAHPDPSHILKESIFSRAEKTGSPKMREIGRRMIREEQGFIPIGPALGGEESYLAWDKIPSPGWTLGTVVVKSELFRRLDMLEQQAVAIGIAGLVLLTAASILVARSLSGPLVSMADTTRRIARGEFEVDLSHIRRRDEVGILAHSIEDMAKGLQQKEFIRDTFGRYLTKEVVASLLESRDGLKLGGEAREITLMMSDLRGVTSLTANMAPEKVISFLNRYLGKMVDILVDHRGVIDEIIGDGILAFFGAPEPMADHARRAVACALAMQRAMAEINAENQKEGLARLEMGIAVHTGTVVVGNIGSETRSKYGAVGADVNFTGRMESYTVGGQVLVSQAVAEALGDTIHIKDTLRVRMKGMPEAVVLYDVNGMNGRVMLAEKRETPVPLPQPVSVVIRRLNKKTLDYKEINGQITHTSQTSAIIETRDAVGRWEDIRVGFPGGTGEFYGKVTKVTSLKDNNREILVRTTSLSADAYPLFSYG
ncbi:MAG: HAMP domain-containing protein [Desulfobacterales bacterium]|nr:HAMP domain-containing protein [Desulfobacterales bacterium]